MKVKRTNWYKFYLKVKRTDCYKFYMTVKRIDCYKEMHSVFRNMFDDQNSILISFLFINKCDVVVISDEEQELYCLLIELKIVCLINCD